MSNIPPLPPENIRESFSSDTDVSKKEMNTGVKLKRKESKVSRAEQQEKLDEAAKEVTKQVEAHLQEALELGRQFIKVIHNKKVPSQKGPVEISVEHEIAREWQRYIMKMNNDETRPEGEGSASALSLVFSCLLKLRDRINILDYELGLQKKENADLKNTLADMQTNKDSSSD